MKNYNIVLELTTTRNRVDEYLTAWNNETGFIGTNLELENARPYDQEQARLIVEELTKRLGHIYKIKAVKR
jgi:hypothetical protein